jgi:hypothetical protein
MDSNEEQLLRPVPPVGDSLIIAAFIVIVLIAAMEIALALRGIRATSVDDEHTWMLQRHRASTLGNRALILVGASRIQTGIDIDVLRAKTKLEPVQLAIDGSVYAPILKGLAEDPTVTGTILVSYQAPTVTPLNNADIASRYERDYEGARNQLTAIDFATVEYTLDSAVRSRMRSFADGARPLTTLVRRIVTFAPSRQYATFLPDRSRLADYSAVDIIEIYYGRVLRELGSDLTIQPGEKLDSIDAEIRKEIAKSPEIPDSVYGSATAEIAEYVKAIQSRGGRVIFVVFPTGGLITEIEDHACPRSRCWDQFVKMVPSQSLNFEDVPYLRSIPVPDGSHIDFRNRPQLTSALVDLLNLREAPPKTD